MPASPIGSYASFLAALIALGPKLQALWPKIQAFYDAAVALVAAVKDLIPAGEAPTPAAGTLALVSVSEEEAELEAQIGYHVAGPNAAFDGSRLRSIWQFAQQHPEIVSLLLSLLKG